MPKYSGMGSDFSEYLMKNLKYSNRETFQASFNVEFIIDSHGRLIYPKIISKNSKNMTPAEKELIKVLSKMPKWNPGKCNGKYVPVQMYLPLRF
jgi:hypothetical protein